ncbi:MAG: hypothetical protein LLF76_07210 [Planctomycetaceae bacterium]|nr:hypothetical protein [Planctomycetaceae bacterium]
MLWAVIRAFLIPIAVFISSLAAVQWLLRGILSDKALIAAAFAGGVCITLLWVFGMRALERRFAKKC